MSNLKPLDMIDNVKFFVSDKDGFEQSLCKSTSIDLRTYCDVITGEVLDYPKVGRYFNLEVRVTKSQAYLKGSLHKFFNLYLTGDDHNHNDFDFEDVCIVIDEISSQFHVDLDNAKVTNLEFGFNIPVNQNPVSIIDGGILMFGMKAPNKNQKFNGKGDYLEFERGDYSMKIYNKSKQYGLESHILRVEIKITMRRVLQRLGIFTLSDLKKKSVMLALFNYFLDKFEQLVIVDSFYERPDIPKSKRERLATFTNPNFWLHKKTPQVKLRLIREFHRLLEKYDLLITKNGLRDDLKSRFDRLLHKEGLREAC